MAELTPQQQEAERRLNGAFASAFSGPDGQAVLDHLRGNFINLIKGPGCTDAELRYHEGGRAVVALIEMRVEAGRMKSAARPGESNTDRSRSSRSRSGRSSSRKPAARD